MALISEVVVMKYLISLSGGIGSFYTVKNLLDKGIKKENIELIFCDTLAEDGDLYRFLNDIERVFEMKITRLCVGKSPIELCFEDNFLYNSRIANCSKKLKSKPFREYIKKYSCDEVVLVFGIDFTEAHRCAAIERNYKPYKVYFPLCEPPYTDKVEMLGSLKDYNLEVPRLYKLGFGHNNCKGCCVKAGIGHFKNLLEKDRITYLEFENKEERIRERLGKNVAIMKRKGQPFTLKQLRYMVEHEPKQLTIDECLDYGACGCFVDDE